ncbi:MAG: hypothetical protein V3S55_09510 [Nitrospiraceae bacterium]
MPHADTRRPFTRRGPPTEEEEREALRQRRAKSAEGLPAPRSIPRTAFDPAHPTINPPAGRDNGPRTQAELTAADAARTAAGAQPPVRPAPSQELLDQRRTRAEVSAFNRAEAKRKFDERRREMGLPPTAQQRGDVIKTQAARHALLDGNTEDVPPLQGTLENATRRGQANPDILPHNQIVRTTVKGRETFQRWNAIRRDFTPVTIDPLTGRIGIDTSDQAALSDAAVDDSFSTRITALRGLAADPDVDPNSAKQFEFIASGLEAIQEAVGVVGRAEALKQANTLYAKAAAFIETEEEGLTDIQTALLSRQHTRPDKTEFILQPDGKIDRFTPKPEDQAPPTSVQELIRTEKGQKVYLDLFNDTFNTMAKIAADQLKVRNAAITKKNTDEGTNTPLEAAEDINIDDAVALTRQILSSLFPPAALVTPETDFSDIIEAETAGFGQKSIEDFSEAAIRRAATRRQIDTVGLTIDEIKAALIAAPTVP